jgi:UDP-N-acetylmuramyl pentapeptide phosphotransferase/UDP-N-acetylglucosamine-1-phosphate transferase
MRILAVVLIVVGVLIFAYPVITYTTRDEVVDLGPIEVTQQERHRVPLSPILGGVAVVAGIVLLVTGRRKVA